jgi:hypothetical protein
MYRPLHGPVDDLVSKLGLPAGSGWGAITPAALIVLQRAGGLYPMMPSGRFDAPTALNAGYYKLEDGFSPAQVAYIKATTPAMPPSSLGRDFATMSAQVPQWAWLALGVGFLGLGGYLYYRARKAEK